MNDQDQVRSQEVSNQEPFPEVLTVEEAAKFLRVETGRLKSAVKKGEIPGVRRIGRHLRFHRETLLRWLDGETCSVDKEQATTRAPAAENLLDPHINRDAEKPSTSVNNTLDHLSTKGPLINRELAKLNRTLRRTCGARRRITWEPDWWGQRVLDLYWGHLNRKAREAVATAARDYTENASVTFGCSCRDLDSTLAFIREVNANLTATIEQKGVAAHG